MLYQYILIWFALKSRLGLKLIYKNNFTRFAAICAFIGKASSVKASKMVPQIFARELESEILSGFQRGEISKIKFKTKDKI